MSRNYEYVVRLDGKEVWRGKNPKKILVELKKKNPNKRVSISNEVHYDIPSFCLEPPSWKDFDKAVSRLRKFGSEKGITEESIDLAIKESRRNP